MFGILLAVIYMAFISLGLPDSLLGSAWPVMAGEFSAPISYAGVISMLICGGTIVSSLLSDWLTRRFGAGMVTAVSVATTAVALLGFSLSHSFLALCLLAVPYGLGAGAVDAALNNYVALHYASRHMSWLHCFWGLGASIGPYLMGWAIAAGHGWRGGYSAVAIIQVVLSLGLFLSLPLWKKGSGQTDEVEHSEPVGLGKVLRIRGVKEMLMAFFCYCGFESTAALWASSYLAEHRLVAGETAAFYATMFYTGITLGRFISGFIADRLGDRNMIRLGVAVMGCGIVLIAAPFKNVTYALAGLIVFGLGAAPVYPSVIHSTPRNFGADNSQAVVGIQMASAYCGSTLVPPIFGLIAQYVDIALYPYYMALFVLLLLVMTERVNKLCK